MTYISACSGNGRGVSRSANNKNKENGDEE